MQDTEAAIKELERAKATGHVGIQIGSNINDENLSEEKFFPIFEACERLGMAVMVHPWQMMGFDSMKKYWLPWLVGMPAETSRAACSMIFGGVLERLPNLRVCFSHAGGSFLPTLGRIEHGFNCRPDLVAIDNSINPREYVGLVYSGGAPTLGPVMDKYKDAGVDLMHLLTNDNRAFYTRDVGPYSWQKENAPKIFNDLGYLFGFTGNQIDPVKALKGVEFQTRR